MKIVNVLSAVVVLLIAVNVMSCGSSGTSGDADADGITENEALALSDQITDVAINAMNNINPNASVNQDMEVDAIKSVQCSEDGSTCTYNIPIDFRQNCTAGGRIEVLGSLTGTTSDGSGLLQIGATETISDWQCITGFIVNGDPYISLTGTFSFLNGMPSTQQSMTVSGGFKWGTTAEESCQISLSINFSSDGSGTISGTICGYTVNESF